MNPAIRLIELEVERLRSREEFASVEEKAEHIGLLNQLDTAIEQLKLCDWYDIRSGVRVFELPETETPHFRYVVGVGENSTLTGSEQVSFDDGTVDFPGGTLIVER